MGVDSTAPPFPPQQFMFMGEDEHRSTQNGVRLLDVAREQLDWTAGRVLDVGCGYGRLAYALRRDGFSGEYVGIDILPRHITWLQENFTTVDRRFRFHHVDIHNGRYNPNGTLKAADFRVPDLAGPPTVVVALSVFTHMYESDIRAYLTELARVSDATTTCYVTFFVCDEEQRVLNSRLSMDFRLDDGCFYHSEADPLHAIGYTPERVEAMITGAGLRTKARSMGKWCGRPNAASFQDSYFLVRS